MRAHKVLNLEGSAFVYLWVYKQVCEDKLSVRLQYFCCPWMLWTDGRVIIQIDVSHHYCVPQQRQEHSIHHSLKIGMYFHNLPQSLERLYWNETRFFFFNISNKSSSFLYFVIFFYDWLYTFILYLVVSNNDETDVGSIIDLSEVWSSPKGEKL